MDAMSLTGGSYGLLSGPRPAGLRAQEEAPLGDHPFARTQAVQHRQRVAHGGPKPSRAAKISNGPAEAGSPPKLTARAALDLRDLLKTLRGRTDAAGTAPLTTDAADCGSSDAR
jgi:hypothetical protein